MIGIVIDVCVMNLFSDSAREFRLTVYTFYVLHTMNIFRVAQIASVFLKKKLGTRYIWYTSFFTAIRQDIGPFYLVWYPIVFFIFPLNTF